MYYPQEIKQSTNKNKKYTMIFKNKKTGRTKAVHFGDNRYEDYTMHKDDERKKRYINRHKKNENWNDPTKAGTLSRFILWNKPTIRESLKDYLNRFY